MVSENDKILYSDCCQYAIKYISSYPKSEKELSIKLYQKWYNQDQVKNTMKYLKNKWFSDDRIFVEMYVKSQLMNKWKPMIYVYNKLLKKWVDKKIINEVVNENTDDIMSGIYEKIKKEIESYKKKWVDGFDIMQKLIRKWYKLDDIKYVIENRN